MNHSKFDLTKSTILFLDASRTIILERRGFEAKRDCEDRFSLIGAYIRGIGYRTNVKLLDLPVNRF